jgi:hypothetical protein
MQRFLAGYSNRETCRNFETTQVNAGIHFIKFCFTKTNLPLLFCILADIRLELWETSRPKNKHKQINLMSYCTMWLLTAQLFKNSIDTQGKLRLNLHSFSVSELLEYRRKKQCQQSYINIICESIRVTILTIFRFVRTKVSPKKLHVQTIWNYRLQKIAQAVMKLMSQKW